ncbi:MAG: hypothetical protein ACLTQL_01135 [Eisenbergiella sp.]
MNRQGDYVHFCSAETDSAYAVGLLRRQKEKGALTRQEERMLIFMERRMSESTIYLAACSHLCGGESEKQLQLAGTAGQGAKKQMVSERRAVDEGLSCVFREVWLEGAVFRAACGGHHRRAGGGQDAGG